MVQAQISPTATLVLPTLALPGHFPDSPVLKYIVREWGIFGKFKRS